MREIHPNQPYILFIKKCIQKTEHLTLNLKCSDGHKHVYGLKNTVAIEHHIPIPHLDNSYILCAPVRSLARSLSLSLCPLPSISEETEEEKWSISKRSTEGRAKGKEEENVKRRRKGKKKKR